MPMSWSQRVKAALRKPEEISIRTHLSGNASSFQTEVQPPSSSDNRLDSPETQQQPVDVSGAVTPLFLNEPVVPRILDSTGNIPPSACFEDHLEQHAHHHILICGHYVITTEPERCGRNCKPSTTAETKIHGAGFKCLHIDCVRERKTWPVAEAVFYEPSKEPRVCKVSTVQDEGWDADWARKTETAKLRGRRDSVVEQSTQGASNDAENSLFAATRSKLTVGFETIAQINARLRTETREVRNLRVDGTEKLLYSFTSGRSKSKPKKAPYRPSGEKRQRERESVRPQMSAGARYFHRQNASSFGVPEPTPEQTEDDHGEAVQYCICDLEADDGFLVSCKGCANVFHPVCLAKGTMLAAKYEGGETREAAMAHDAEFYKEREFLCIICGEKEGPAGLSVQRPSTRTGTLPQRGPRRTAVERLRAQTRAARPQGVRKPQSSSTNQTRPSTYQGTARLARAAKDAVSSRDSRRR